jgi:hypothetical protein
VEQKGSYLLQVFPPGQNKCPGLGVTLSVPESGGNKQNTEICTGAEGEPNKHSTVSVGLTLSEPSSSKPPCRKEEAEKINRSTGPGIDAISPAG